MNYLVRYTVKHFVKQTGFCKATKRPDLGIQTLNNGSFDITLWTKVI